MSLNDKLKPQIDYRATLLPNHHNREGIKPLSGNQSSPHMRIYS